MQIPETMHAMVLKELGQSLQYMIVPVPRPGTQSTVGIPNTRLPTGGTV